MQANFFVSIQELLTSSHGEDSILNPRVRALFRWPDQPVVAFLRHLAVFEVSHELGVPVTNLTQEMIVDLMKQMKVKGMRKSFEDELQLVKRRFDSLGKMLDFMSVELCDRHI